MWHYWLALVLFILAVATDPASVDSCDPNP